MSLAFPGALAPWKRTACQGSSIRASFQLGDGKSVSTTGRNAGSTSSLDWAFFGPTLCPYTCTRTTWRCERRGEADFVDNGEHDMTFNTLLAVTRAGGEFQECWAPIEDESDEAVGLRTPCMTWQATPHLGALHVVCVLRNPVDGGEHDMAGYTPPGGPVCCALRNPSRGRSGARGWRWTNCETSSTHALLPR